MSYEGLSGMIETHECAVCGMPLVLIYDQESGEYKLVCGVDRSHEGFKAHEGVGVAVARGEGNKVLGPGGQKDMERSLARAKHPLSLMPAKDVGGDNALTPEQLKGLVAWGESLGLKPYLGHVCLYYGSPYVTIDGYYYKLNENVNELSIGTRPLTAQERIDYQVPEGSHAWIAESWQGKNKLPTTGFGLVTLEEINEKSKKTPNEFRAPVVHGHPQRMAEKRAEWQLLRKLVLLDEVPDKGR
jgi:hypothetical protein